MPAYFHLSSPLHLVSSAAAEQQKLPTTVPYKNSVIGEHFWRLTCANLALGGGEADVEVSGHVEPCQHKPFVVIEGQIDVGRIRLGGYCGRRQAAQRRGHW